MELSSSRELNKTLKNFIAPKNLNKTLKNTYLKYF